MKLSLEWLGEFVAWKDSDPHVIARALTLSVAEIESVDVQGELLDKCCVGKVVTISRHPNADRLSLVDVKTDDGMKRVVCGGSNLKEGMLVAFAHVGARVKWHGGDMMTLEPVKIRGEHSEGMICAAEELGLSDYYKPSAADGEHPIIDFTSKNFPVGASLGDVLGLKDTVFDISNTAITHRPDLFSHIGFARECVAIGIASWKKGQPKISKPKFGAKPLPFKISQKEKTLAPGYAACSIEVGDHGTTPDWMKRRLEVLGIRSINVPVDITNYVMLETGVPLHAFDLSRINGKEIAFRESVKGETVTTLDNVTRKLGDGLIVFQDERGIFDLCGVMGDENTSTKDSTRMFFVHAPSFDPIRIRKAIQTLQHRTDAATIFEKGVPPANCVLAVSRAAELFTELCPGVKITSKLFDWQTTADPKPIALDLTKLEATLGVTVKDAKVKQILESLDCSVKAGKKGVLMVTPPVHRVRDLNIEADLVEEVARVIGYDQVPEQMPLSPMRIPVRDKRIHKMRDALKEAGFLELVPLSIMGPKALERSGFDASKAVKLLNPIGEEFSLMQPSGLPSLLVHAEATMRGVEHDLSTFHWGKVFDQKGEWMEFSALVAAKHETTLGSDPFLQLKSAISSALCKAGYKMTIVPGNGSASYMHPGRHAVLVIDGRPVGDLFEVHPSVRHEFHLPFRASALLLNLSQLLEIVPQERLAKPLPRFPEIAYDITVTRSHTSPIEKLLEGTKKADPLLTDITITDLYSGPSVKPGHYNVTLRCTYRSDERTLTEDEVKKAHEKVEKMLQAA